MHKLHNKRAPPGYAGCQDSLWEVGEEMPIKASSPKGFESLGELGEMFDGGECRALLPLGLKVGRHGAACWLEANFCRYVTPAAAPGVKAARQKMCFG